MHRKNLIFVLLSLALCNYVNSLSKKFVTASDFEKIRLNKEGFEKAQIIHYNWYLHSIKAIMGQMGKSLLPLLPTESRRSFLRCLDEIVDKRDIVTAGKCLTEAKSKCFKSSEFLPQRIRSDEAQEMAATKKKKIGNKFENPLVQEFRRINSTVQMIMWENIAKKTTEKKRKIIKLQDNTKYLMTKKFSTKSHLLHKFKERIKGLKLGRVRKYRSTRNIKSHKRSKRSPYRLIASTVSKSDSQEYVVKNMANMPYLKSVSEKSVLKRVMDLVKVIVRKENNTDEGGRWTESYKSLLRIKKALDERAKQPGAKVYDMRMFDLVVGSDHPTKARGEKTLLPPLVHDAYNLIKAFEGNAKEVGDATNIKILSPRLAPIMPDKAEIRGHLSPSILSFYKDDTEEQLIPIPKLLESMGMSKSDRESVLEMVMEVSGARQTIDDAIKTLKNMNLFGLDVELNEVTERISKIFTDLEKTFTESQQNDMKIRGFTFMETNQIEELHEKQGIKNRSDMDFDINEYGNQTREEREQSLWMRVAEIAANGTKTRFKRKITWLSVLKPTVLSPYMFAPMYGLSILGPIVLSPSLFSPLILNPSVLSPYVFSPAVGMPFILSPYILSPYVISPLVMAPFILNPYILSPNVINPYVLSPLILSPLVICPDVISPMVLGGAILSPGVLSPSVLSKSFLMASVLSPTVLS